MREALKWKTNAKTDGSSDVTRMPLTAALLELAAKGLSFQTPGHRCGRSCGAVPRADLVATGSGGH